MDDKFKSRKFIVNLALIIVTAALAYFGKMDGDVATVLTVVALGYNASQGAIDYIKASK